MRSVRPECHCVRRVRPEAGGQCVGALILSLHPIRCVPQDAWDEKYVFADVHQAECL